MYNLNYFRIYLKTQNVLSMFTQYKNILDLYQNNSNHSLFSPIEKVSN
jgi:hypothetical protein